MQETSSTISGLMWEAVLYLNSKQLCVAFSERRDNLLEAHVFVSTSVREMLELWKLPLCGRLITACLRKGIWGCIASLQGQAWKLSGQWEEVCALPQRKNWRTKLSAYCLSSLIHISVLCVNWYLLHAWPCSKIKDNNISTCSCHAETAKEN